MSPALAGGFLTTVTPGKPPFIFKMTLCCVALIPSLKVNHNMTVYGFTLLYTPSFLMKTFRLVLGFSTANEGARPQAAPVTQVTLK